MDLINTDQLSKRLNVVRNTIFLWRKRGLPFIKVGGEKSSVKYDYDDVIAWMKSMSYKGK